MKRLLIPLMWLLSIVAEGQCFTNGAPDAPVVSGTGLQALDRDVQLEARRLEREFDVESTVQFVDDSRSPNAFADPSGFVYLGVHLFKSELHDPQGGPTALVGIEAHEFAHVLQGSRHSRLRGSQLELHADFMAGWYLAREYKHRGLRPREFARSLYDKGDWDFYSPTHHGTPQQRVEAMLAGFQLADLSLDEAYERGEQYVLGN